MAKYKYGSKEVNLLKYIHNLDSNLNTLFERKGWNEQQQQQFKDAYNKYIGGFNSLLKDGSDRFSTDAFGVITDNTGELNDGDVSLYFDDKGNSITADDYNNLKDKKKGKYKGFNANREVASYFKEIGDLLLAQGLEKAKSFKDYFNEQEAPGGTVDFNNYAGLDTKESGTTNRLKFLAGIAQRYLDLLDPDLDYSQYGGFDKYKENLGNAIVSLNDGTFDSNDLLAMLRAGIDSTYFKPLFGDSSQEATTSDDYVKQRIEQWRQEAIKLGYLSLEDLDNYIAMKQRELDLHSQQLKDYNSYMAMTDLLNHKWLEFQNTPFNFTAVDYTRPYAKWTHWDSSEADKRFRALNLKGMTDVNAQILALNSYLPTDLLNGKSDMIPGGTYHYKTPYEKSKLITARASVELELTDLKEKQRRNMGNGFYAMPWTIDYSDNTVFAYSPSKKRVLKFHLSQAGQYGKEAMYRQWFPNYDLLTDSYNMLLAAALPETVQSAKKGGKLQWGGPIGYDIHELENNKRYRQAREFAAKQRKDKIEAGKNYNTGQFGTWIDERTDEENLAGLQKLKVKDQSLLASLTARDWWRICNATADLASAVTAFAPGYGTATSAITGVGSTFSNLLADATDDAVSGGQTLTNFGTGLAMDVVGLIPGLGTGAKAAKIAKVLKPTKKVLYTALTALGTRDAIAGIGALEKIFTDPENATKDDLLAAIRGVTAAAGLGRHVAGQRRLDLNTVKRTTATVKGKNGDIKLSKELLKELRGQKGLDAQNKFLKGNGITDELAQEFRGRQFGWNPVKWRLWNSGPSVSTTSTRYIRQGAPDAGWYLRSPFGMTYEGTPNRTPVATPTLPVAALPTPRQTVAPGLPSPRRMRLLATGQFTPQQLNARGIYKEGGKFDNVRKFQNSGILNFTLPQTSYTLDLGIKKPEEFLLQTPTLSTSLVIDVNARRKAARDYYLSRYKQQILLGKPLEQRYNFAGETLTGEGALHHLDETLKTAEDKNYGYILNRDLVGRDILHYYDDLKYATIDDLIRAYNSDADIIDSTWIGDDRNNLTYNDKGYQKHNLLFRRMFNSRSVDGKENYQIGYQDNLDDILGTSTWMRRMDTYRNKWYDADDDEKKSRMHLITLANGTKGWVYKTQDGRLAKLSDEEANKLLNPQTTSPNNNNSSVTTPAATQESKKPNPQNGIADWVKDTVGNLDPYALSRLWLAENANARMTKLAIASQKPYYENPLVKQRYERSDLDAENMGHRAAGLLHNQAQNTGTTDMERFMANRGDSTIKGQEAIATQNAQSNAKLRETQEKVWQLGSANMDSEHTVAEANRKSGLQTLSNIANLKLAQIAKRHSNIDTFLQELQYNKQKKDAENKAWEEYFLENDIKNAVYSDPNSYLDTPLTNIEKSAIDKLRSGITFSNLTKEEQAVAATAKSKVDLALNRQMKIAFGILDNKWARARGYTNKESLPSYKLFKKGGKVKKESDGAKIKIASIRSNTASAKLFFDNINKKLDRLEKAINRLDKHMYDLKEKKKKK